MRIAVNTRFLLPHKMEGFGWYTYEIVKRLVENHPEHTFILFFDRKYDPKFVFGDNVIPVVLNPQARHPILFKIWFNISVKRALKKYKADLFFSPDGYLSIPTDIPQIPVIHDLNFEHNPEDLKPSHRNYYRKYFPIFAKKAQHIITVSEYSKQDICTTYKIPENKVTAIWNGASEQFKALSEAEKRPIRDAFSEGQEYILFVGAIHPRKNVRRLIEAYQVYRKENPDAKEKLVIVGTELWSKAGFDIEINEELKKDILFTGHLPLEQLSKVMASAKIFAFVPYFEGFGIPLVEAMRCGTPILSGDKTSLPEVAGDAALYCDPFDVNDIAAKLQQLAQDENLRAQLSEAGSKRSSLFSWDKSADQVWEIIANELKSD